MEGGLTQTDGGVADREQHLTTRHFAYSLGSSDDDVAEAVEKDREKVCRRAARDWMSAMKSSVSRCVSSVLTIT